LLTIARRTNKSYMNGRVAGVRIAGGQSPYKEMELHHILPFARFPELGQSIRNGIMLCHRCHKEIHCNPYLNIKLMEAKAKEFGIDLNERYDIGSI
jgi:hypothetical protein